MVFFAFTEVYSQRNLKLSTNGRGTLFGDFNYNRSYYGTSTLDFDGDGYVFSLRNVLFSDNKNHEGGYLNNSGFENIQFTGNIGYFISPKWALSLGFARYNLFMQHDHSYNLDGTFAPNIHNDFEGSYNGSSINLNSDQLNYEQIDGANYLSLAVHRSDLLYKQRKAYVEILSDISIGGGVLFSNADYTFNYSTRQQNNSLSGVGFHTSLGIKTIFSQIFYLRLGARTGVLNNGNVELGQQSSLSHTVGFISPEIGLGFSYFFKTDDCNTCPQW